MAGDEMSPHDRELKRIAGGIRAAINDHGPITTSLIQSAAKRVLGTFKGPGIMHLRAWDLLRQMRMHLLDANLIDTHEYAWLASESPAADPRPGMGSQAPRRLEDYDRTRARLEEERDTARAALAAAEQKIERMRAHLRERHGCDTFDHVPIDVV
jgi:hypothetical protein